METMTKESKTEMKTLMGIQEVLKYLPHRHPFLMIDKVVQIQEGQSLVAVKNVSINEPFFTGHFPGNPVMPGVLILEALAQAASILAHLVAESQGVSAGLHVFAGIDKARFRRMVVPGDQLMLKVDLIKARKDIWKLHGVATVEGDLACEADLISAKIESTTSDT